MLLSGGRLTVQDVARQAGVSRPAVWRWQQRYGEEGVAGLLHDGHVAVVREKELGDQFMELVTPGLYKPFIGLDWSNPLLMETDTIIT